MSEEIYLLQDDGELQELLLKPYDSEKLLQELLAKYPNLLAGKQIDSTSPRRWLLITREALLPSEEDGAGRWSLDHFFLDQDAIPTLVEVKRSSDTRLRREVVGQMLDYAANSVVYWPVEDIRSSFENTCKNDNIEPEQFLQEFLDEEEPEKYWERVHANLRAGKIRMLFVADEIPPELQRVVEYLNSQMDPAEVLAVEIKQFVGQGLKTLVPRVIGHALAKQQKRSRESKQWDESSFMERLMSQKGEAELSVAQKVLEWAKSKGVNTWWGKGATEGTFFPMPEHNGEQYWTFSVSTGGRVRVQFGMIKKHPPFDDQEKRIELLKRLNEIPGVELPADSIEVYPAFPLSVLFKKDYLEQFLSIFDWYIEEVKHQDEF